MKEHFSFVISLHICSMWETICDAKAYRKCDGKFCAQNPQFTPKLEFGSRTPPSNFQTPIFFPEFRSDLWQNTPPPKFPKSNFLPKDQIWPLAAPPPPNFQTPIFFPDSKSDLWQNTPQISKLKFSSPIPNLTFGRTPPPQISKLQFSSPSPNLTCGRTHPAPPISKLQFSSQIPNLTFGRTPPPPDGSCSMWSLIAVSPKDTVSLERLVEVGYTCTWNASLQNSCTVSRPWWIF